MTALCYKLPPSRCWNFGNIQDIFCTEAADLARTIDPQRITDMYVAYRWWGSLWSFHYYPLLRTTVVFLAEITNQYVVESLTGMSDSFCIKKKSWKRFGQPLIMIHHLTIWSNGNQTKKAFPMFQKRWIQSSNASFLCCIWKCTFKIWNNLWWMSVRTFERSNQYNAWLELIAQVHTAYCLLAERSITSSTARSTSHLQMIQPELQRHILSTAVMHS